jgi:hypothetical protein
VYLTDKSFKQVSKRTKELYDYLKINDKKYDYERSLNSYLDDDSWYDYECVSIKRQDYERFFNLSSMDSPDLQPTEKNATAAKSQKSLFEKVKIFMKNILEQGK